MRLGYTVRASVNMLCHPVAGVERIRGRMDRHRDRRALTALGIPQSEIYQVSADWRERVHEAICAPWPCGETESFDVVWDATIADLKAAGLRVGLASYAGWNDGDRSQAEALWCLVSHMRPEIVVETGVAHGLTSRVVLEAMHRNGAGRLWSVDLPAVDPVLHHEIGSAIHDRLRSRWTYVAGTSREQLPRLVADLGAVDLFIHDSLHTQRNLCFELDTIWPALRAGGVAVADDIDHSLGFKAFVEAARPDSWLAVRHVTGSGLWGVAVKATLTSAASAGTHRFS